MQQILVLGGGVGGTLVANLISRRLKRPIDRGEARVTVVDERGTHVYQPGFMAIAMGDERAERLERPERSLLDARVQLVVGRVTAISEEDRVVRLDDGTLVRTRSAGPPLVRRGDRVTVRPTVASATAYPLPADAGGTATATAPATASAAAD